VCWAGATGALAISLACCVSRAAMGSGGGLASGVVVVCSGGRTWWCAWGRCVWGVVGEGRCRLDVYRGSAGVKSVVRRAVGL